MSIENDQQSPALGEESLPGREMPPEDLTGSTRTSASERKKEKNGHPSQGRRATNSGLDNSALVRWQTRLLPLMSLFLVGLTIFFLAASFYQLYTFQTSIMSKPQSLFEKELEAFRPVPGDLPSNAFEKGRWATLVRLEADAMERRYHQATTVTVARVWTIYLGFLTGMILSLVGAAFILGKLRESASEMDLSSREWKAAVRSTSPGVILAVLGTALMIVTILARVEVKVEDRPLFVSDVGSAPSQSSDNAKDSQEAPEGTDHISVVPPTPDDDQSIIKDAERKLGPGRSTAPSPMQSPRPNSQR